MHIVLGALVILFNLADNATTFHCLKEPLPGAVLFEANPVARWLFDSIGLMEGLLLETAITTAAVVFLVLTPNVVTRVKLAVLGVLLVLPIFAVANNLNVMHQVGISF